MTYSTPTPKGITPEGITPEGIIDELEELSLLINSLSKLNDVYNKLNNLTSTFETINTFASKFTSEDKLTEFSTMVNNLTSYYKDLIVTLKNNNYSYFNILKQPYKDINIDKINIEILDQNFNVINTTIDINNDNLYIDLSTLYDDFYYVKFSQNMENTKKLSDTTFTISKFEVINDDSSKILIPISDKNLLDNILNNRQLDDSLCMIDGSKYNIIRYGSTTILNINYLVLMLYPKLEFVTDNNITFYSNELEDNILELSLFDNNISDISNYYFNKAERDLDNNTIKIYNNKGNAIKYLINYDTINNIETRTTIKV